jgi:thiol-disulfide isomerase/thioredoxin
MLFNLSSSLWCCTKTKPLKPSLAAPLLDFRDPNGKPVSLKSMLSGKKGLLINFFYYGCGYCQKEFPHLQNLYQATKDTGLAVLTINKGDDTIPQIKAFLKASKLTIPCAVNGDQAVKLYGVQGYPTNYLISPNGKVAYSSSGFGEESFQRLVDEVGKLGISTMNYKVKN